MSAMDVKDAYLMCSQPKKVKVALDKALADRLNLPQEWLLGRILPRQREGAAQWSQELKKCLIEAGLVPCPEAPTLWRGEQLILLVHVDDTIIGGTNEAVAKITDQLMKRLQDHQCGGPDDKDHGEQEVHPQLGQVGEPSETVKDTRNSGGRWSRDEGDR